MSDVSAGSRLSGLSQTVKVYFENRGPISSELDAEALLRELGERLAEGVRRAGY